MSLPVEMDSENGSQITLASKKRKRISYAKKLTGESANFLVSRSIKSDVTSSSRLSSSSETSVRQGATSAAQPSTKTKKLKKSADTKSYVIALIPSEFKAIGDLLGMVYHHNKKLRQIV